MLKKRILILTGFTISVILVYLLTFVGNNPDYVLPRRITKIAAMALIACSIGYSSVVFQTITNQFLVFGFTYVWFCFNTIPRAVQKTTSSCLLPAFSRIDFGRNF